MAWSTVSRVTDKSLDDPTDFIKRLRFLLSRQNRKTSCCDRLTVMVRETDALSPVNFQAHHASSAVTPATAIVAPTALPLSPSVELSAAPSEARSMASAPTRDQTPGPGL